MLSNSPKPPETPRSKSERVMGAENGRSASVAEFRTRRQQAVLTSSLSIPVAGSLPIMRPVYGPRVSGGNSQTNGSASTSQQTVVRRAPRRSKTEAMAALQLQSGNIVADDVFMSDATAVEVTDLVSSPIPSSPMLDPTSVKSTTPRHSSLRRPRPFQIPECPTFHPTVEEFKDPMCYIQSIADIGKKYGLCKIVPPEGWKMPFVTDSTTFRFKTRVQRLNEIEAAARAKINFLEQLHKFHSQQGNSKLSIPHINQKPLDLWQLRKEVRGMGGYEKVTKDRNWGDVGRRLGYTGIPTLSTQLKTSYTRVILPFEDYTQRVLNSPALSPSVNRSQNPQLRTHQNIQTLTRMSIVNARDSVATGPVGSPPPSSPLSYFSSPLSEPPDDAEGGAGESEPGGDTIASPKTPQVRTVSALLSAAEATPHARTGEICEVCQRSNRGKEMLLCDGCDCGFHIFCLDPPLSSIPRGEWYCHTCLFGQGEDFGFDEGEEHSLSSFQARDKAFRSMWFQTHPPQSTANDEWSTQIGGLAVPESFVEKEFWRLVESTSESVEIEYGADVHSTTHGSAMPTLETFPDDPYSKDGWNLNNLPIAPYSLLRYIKSDISGMTVPWTYVGMLFSTFCWHNEDHYTYSINYMHWGETKTWYGIPGKDAETFEAAMKKEAPDLFEVQPDLLFQLVTLMNPTRLQKVGVTVSACDQRAGEFVITFPKAYHAGFNHGLNFNEAVNFALPDWLPFDRECVSRYQEHRKLPVFSHDELLITITQFSQSIKTALWLFPSLKEMKERELGQRKSLRDSISNLIESTDQQDKPEDQYQCSICNVFCYLSQTVCKCGLKVACLEHVAELCSCSEPSITLRLRFADAELIDICDKVEERALLPTTWQQKLFKVLGESSKPSLRALRAILAEGERIGYNLPDLANLRSCVSRANDWVDSANNIIARKQNRKRSKRTRGVRPGEPPKPETVDEAMDRPDKRLSDVYRLLDDVESLGFDSPEVASLRTVVSQAEDLRVKASAAFGSFRSSELSTSFIAECDSMLTEASSLNIYLEEVYDLERLVLQHRLLEDIAAVDDSVITLDDVRALLGRARMCELDMDHPRIVLLLKRQDAGDNWEQKAARVMSQSFKTIEELDEFENPESNIPVDPTVLEKLRASRAKAVEFERQANSWLHPEPGSPLPKLQDVLRLVAKAEKEFSIPAVRELRRTADFAGDLEQRCESVLKRKYKHTEDRPIFETMRGWGHYAKEHLTKFQLPNFEKLDEQLEAHERWMERLPWYCSLHKAKHGDQVYDDVLACTEPDDDIAPDDEYFTCICDEPVCPPPAGGLSDAVQCDHCFARFHGLCARRGGSCPFCDRAHWNFSLHRERPYHFCYMPTILLGAPDVTKYFSPEWKQLEQIVSRVDRLSQFLGAFLTYASQPINQRPELLIQVRHYMRKLFKLGFAVAPNPDVSYGLDLAGLHRVLANHPSPTRPRKRRRPKFTFRQDLDTDWADGTRCICRGRTPYLLNYPCVQCESCNRLYHAACVFYKLEPHKTNPAFHCPLCLLRKNRPYPNADVRVRFAEDGDPNLYIDIRSCIDKFSRELVRKVLPPPTTNTVFVEIARFTPGCPESAAVPNAEGSLPDSPIGGDTILAETSTGSVTNLKAHGKVREPSPRGTKRKAGIEGEVRSPPQRPDSNGIASHSSSKAASRKTASHLRVDSNSDITAAFAPYSKLTDIESNRASTSRKDDPKRKVDGNIVGSKSSGRNPLLEYMNPSGAARIVNGSAMTSGKPSTDANTISAVQSPTIRKIKLLVKRLPDQEKPNLPSTRT